MDQADIFNALEMLMSSQMKLMNIIEVASTSPDGWEPAGDSAQVIIEELISDLQGGNNEGQK